jgi:hypothetical protein
MTPQGTILASIIIAGAILTVRGLATADLSPRTYAGLAVVAFFLIAIGQFSPELASAFAVLVLIAVLLSGASDLEGLLKLIGKGAVKQDGR